MFLNCLPIVAPFDQVPFKFFDVSFIVGGTGAYSPHPEGLAVGDASLGVRGMATTVVEVLMGVRQLGIEVSDQVVPFMYHCGIHINISTS